MKPERSTTRALPAMVLRHGPVTLDGLEQILHVSPRDGRERLWRVPICGPEQIAAASAEAKRAAEDWRSWRMERRIELILKISSQIEAESEALSRQMASEIGKPVRDARQEVAFGVDLLRSAVRNAASGRDEGHGKGWRLRRRPLGVVGVITPWNNPLAIPLGKIAPALLHGNTVVWKPSPYGAAVALRTLELLLAAGLAPGTVTLAQGDRTTAESLMLDAKIDAVTLTGSSRAGYDAQVICAGRRIPFQGELGGNNAAIVWSDADLADAARQVALAGMGSAGQRCTANRRVIVDHRCSGDFVSELQDAIAALSFGDPLDDATHVGPVVSQAARRRIASVVDRARASGATVFVPPAFEESATEWARQGFYYPPTLIGCEDRRSEIVQDETFGPVIVVQGARGWDDAMDLCNGVRQGLVAALFSGSEDRHQSFLDAAHAGLLKINMATAGAAAGAPFGGWKASGVGPPEHGVGDVAFYTRCQALYERELPSPGTESASRSSGRRMDCDGAGQNLHSGFPVHHRRCTHGPPARLRAFFGESRSMSTAYPYRIEDITTELARELHEGHMKLLGIENTMRLAHAYNSSQYGRQDEWRRAMYRDELPALLAENGQPTCPPLEMSDGFVIDRSMSLPHLDRVLEDSEKVIAERAGSRLSCKGAYRSYFQDMWTPEDAVKYPSFLDFATSSDVLSAVSRYLESIPVLSTTLPAGVRLVESNALYDDQPGCPRDSQLYHIDYYSLPNVYVIVLLEDTTHEHGPWTFIPRSVSQKARKALGYWQQGKDYRVSDEELFSVVDRDQVIEFACPRGTVLFIESSGCFHFGSRNSVKPRFQAMYGYSGAVRTDFSELIMQPQVYPVRETDSRLRRMVLDRGLLPRSGTSD